MKIPLRDFFRNPEKTGYQLSPDGQHIAYSAPYKNRMNIHVRPLNSDKEICKSQPGPFFPHWQYKVYHLGRLLVPKVH